MAPATQGSDAPVGPSSKKPKISFWLLMVGLVIMLAGLLFGYDQGVIAGALQGIQSSFHIGSTMTEVITSWVTLGALFGALAAGVIADRVGRRHALLVAGGLFTAGAALESLAPGTGVLVVGRLVVGFGVGVASVAAPLYAAEHAPTRWRGRFVSTYQLAITIGIFVAYLVDEALTSGNDWRLMLGISAVPAVLLVIVMVPMPDTPRWLMKVGRRREAAASLAKVRPDVDVEADLDDIAAHIAEESDEASWSEVFSQKLRRPLLVGIGLAVFQQITGINAIIYYADKIFAAAGFATPASQASATTWAIGGVNVLATLIAVVYVDHFGRRPLLKIGLVGMASSLLTVAIAFHYLDKVSDAAGSTAPPGTPSAAGVVTLVALVVFIASFAFSLGPVVWTVINEIFPSRVRGRAVAVCTAVNWFTAFLVSEFFLSLIDWIGTSATFALFAAFSVVAYIWVTLRVPETKARSLEQIQQLWAQDDPVAASEAP
jgi:MFS transporter, SP family, galactose:H+ symporter